MTYPPKDPECGSCGETPANECPRSERACGHHCNHTWEQDECCWCGTTFGEGEPVMPEAIAADVEAAAEAIYSAWPRAGQPYWETLINKETYRRLACAALSAARRTSASAGRES